MKKEGFILKKNQTNLSYPTFSKRFLDKYVGKIISDPKIALVELVANSWDAGSTNVQLIWPKSPDSYFEILDNGTGMTIDEFEERWNELTYDRLKVQGPTVKIPESDKNIERKVFGRNGKGRHSLFCFSNKYYVETWKEGFKSKFTVTRAYTNVPYSIELIETSPVKGHGTKISCNFKNGLIKQDLLNVDEVREILGSKFIVDPMAFEIFVNNDRINSVDLVSQATEHELIIPNEGSVKIFVIDSKSPGRTTKQHGVAWWVNNRLVGEHSWKDFKGSYLDGRRTAARRYTIIVVADILENEVKEDWTGFENTDRVKEITNVINEFIIETIADIMHDVFVETKMEVLVKQKENLRQASPSSRNEIGYFINQVQKRCPSIKYKDFENIVDVLVKMEASKSEYRLLQQLAQLSPDNMDSLSAILDEWDIMDAKIVLNELKDRLDIIEKMERLVEKSDTDELHELQPLFAHGLWIFGPEYESIEFLSNKSLATVIKTFFDKKGVKCLQNPRNRPDFVVLADSSISAYSSNKYDCNGEVSGIDKILIVELKKGGSKITLENKMQTVKYALEIRDAGKVAQDTKMICYVLGTNVDLNVNQPLTEGSIEVIPRPYSTILSQAHARTFNLMKKIQEYKQIDFVETEDPEIKDVLKQKTFA